MLCSQKESQEMMIKKRAETFDQKKEEKTRDIPERASQRQQVNVNPSFWTQQTRNLKAEEDNKRKRERERELKRRYKDCCCWSNGHSSELVHIPEKRKEEKQEKNMEELEKDYFIPLLLTVFFFFWFKFLSLSFSFVNRNLFGQTSERMTICDGLFHVVV